MTGTGRRRTWLAVAAVAVVAAGLAVSRGDGLAADLGGGALYTCLVYVLVALVAPLARPWTVGATALAVSIAVELAQLTHLPRDVVAQVPLAHYVLGTTFAPTDLLAAAAGAALATAVDLTARARVSDRATRPA